MFDINWSIYHRNVWMNRHLDKRKQEISSRARIRLLTTRIFFIDFFLFFTGICRCGLFIRRCVVRFWWCGLSFLFTFLFLIRFIIPTFWCIRSCGCLRCIIRLGNEKETLKNDMTPSLYAFSRFSLSSTCSSFVSSSIALIFDDWFNPSSLLNTLDMFSRCRCIVNVTTAPVVMICSSSSSKTKQNESKG